MQNTIKMVISGRIVSSIKQTIWVRAKNSQLRSEAVDVIVVYRSKSIRLHALDDVRNDPIDHIARQRERRSTNYPNRNHSGRADLVSYISLVHFTDNDPLLSRGLGFPERDILVTVVSAFCERAESSPIGVTAFTSEFCAMLKPCDRVSSFDLCSNVTSPFSHTSDHFAWLSIPLRHNDEDSQ